MKIKNHEDLNSEIKRLEGKSQKQEQELFRRVHSLRERFTPVNIILNSLSSLTGIPLNKSELIKKGALVSLAFLLQTVMRKSELKFETLITDFMKKAVEKVKSIFSSEGDPENEVEIDTEPDNGN